MNRMSHMHGGGYGENFLQSQEAIDMFKPYIDSAITHGPYVGRIISNTVICLAVFNTIVHMGLAVSMLLGNELGKRVWLDTSSGRKFQKPGSGIKYLLTGPGLELLSLVNYFLLGAADGTLRLYAVQLFAIGGCGAYNDFSFSIPVQRERHSTNMLFVESAFVFGMCCDARVKLSVNHCLWTYCGCKLLGYLWGGSVVYVLRKLKIATFPYEAPPEPTPEEKAAAEAAAKLEAEAERKRAEALRKRFEAKEEAGRRREEKDQEMDIRKMLEQVAYSGREKVD